MHVYTVKNKYVYLTNYMYYQNVKWKPTKIKVDKKAQ